MLFFLDEIKTVSVHKLTLMKKTWATTVCVVHSTSRLWYACMHLMATNVGALEWFGGVGWWSVAEMDVNHSNTMPQKFNWSGATKMNESKKKTIILSKLMEVWIKHVGIGFIFVAFYLNFPKMYSVRADSLHITFNHGNGNVLCCHNCDSTRGREKNWNSNEWEIHCLLYKIYIGVLLHII